MKLILFSTFLTWVVLYSLVWAEKNSFRDEGHGARETKAKNLIYFIGDGMGSAIMSASRIYHYGAEGSLKMEALPITGYSKTYSHDDYVTDSAASGTALATGVKTDNGVIGLGPKNEKGQRESVENILEKAIKKGKAVGIVTTARVTHATPAAFYAHIDHRDKEEEIADQFLRSQVTLLLGGGRSFFYPSSWNDPEEKQQKGLRRDGRNLVEELTSKQWTFLQGKNDFERVASNPQIKSKILGLFSYSHMSYELNREDDLLGEPTLAEMVRFAVMKLSQFENGYILIVEGGRIDHASHENLIRHSVEEVKAFDDAIGEAKRIIGGQTLMVVTADHETGGIAINGGPRDVISNGKRLLDPPSEEHKESHPPISWGTGPSASASPKESFDFNSIYLGTRAAYFRDSASHTAVDVPVLADGPGAQLFSGYYSNHQIAVKIIKALSL